MEAKTFLAGSWEKTVVRVIGHPDTRTVYVSLSRAEQKSRWLTMTCGITLHEDEIDDLIATLGEAKKYAAVARLKAEKQSTSAEVRRKPAKASAKPAVDAAEASKSCLPRCSGRATSRRKSPA